jgi:hypothetical protein
LSCRFAIELVRQFLQEFAAVAIAGELRRGDGSQQVVVAVEVVR